jgi:hypothetical protein
MRVIGFFLLVSGWAIVLAAIALLRAAPQTGFVVAGICIQLAGLTVAVRSHLIPHLDPHADPRDGGRR